MCGQAGSGSIACAWNEALVHDEPPAMTQSLAHISLLVRDMTRRSPSSAAHSSRTCRSPDEGKHWVTVAPTGAPAGAVSLLLPGTASPEQARLIGVQAGGPVFLFLATSDFARDHVTMLAKGVTFVRKSMLTDYGTVAVFRSPSPSLGSGGVSPPLRALSDDAGVAADGAGRSRPPPSRRWFRASPGRAA